MLFNDYEFSKMGIQGNGVILFVWNLKKLSERAAKHNTTDKHKKHSSGGVLTKDVLKNFAKLTDKYLSLSLFSNKITGWKLETVRSSHWGCSVKNVFLKMRASVSEPASHRSSRK